MKIFGSCCPSSPKAVGTGFGTYPFDYFHKELSGIGDISLAFNNLNEVPTQGQVDDIGLFDRFWANEIDLVNDGRMLIVYLNLDVSDIQNLDFSILKLIDGDYYILNKIVDFKANKKETTKTELIALRKLIQLNF